MWQEILSPHRYQSPKRVGLDLYYSLKKTAPATKCINQEVHKAVERPKTRKSGCMDSGFDNAASYYINVGHITLFACVSISPAVKDGLVALNCGSELPLTILEVVSVPLIR